MVKASPQPTWGLFLPQFSQVEKVLPLDPMEHYPLCLGGARAFPREDSGEMPGYDLLREAPFDAKHPKREEYRTWAGEHYDPERLNLKETNERLREMN